MVHLRSRVTTFHIYDISSPKALWHYRTPHTHTPQASKSCLPWPPPPPLNVPQAWSVVAWPWLKPPSSSTR